MNKEKKQTERMDITLRENIRRDRIRNLNLEDDVFFNEVVKEPEACGDILRILLNEPNLRIKNVTVQYGIPNLYNRALILDVLAVEGKSFEKRYFNVEMQKEDGDDHVKRVRYHQGAIDTKILAKGTHFKELSDLYLIFITRNDFLSLGEPLGIVKRMVKGKNAEVDNGVYEIYANTETHPNAEGSVYELLRYIRNTEKDNEREEFRNLAEVVNYFKFHKEGVKYMSSIMDLERQEGREEGRVEGDIRKIRIKVTKHQTSDVIASSLELDGDYVNQIIQLILENPIMSDEELTKVFVEEYSTI